MLRCGLDTPTAPPRQRSVVRGSARRWSIDHDAYNIIVVASVGRGCFHIRRSRRVLMPAEIALAERVDANIRCEERILEQRRILPKCSSFRSAVCNRVRQTCACIADPMRTLPIGKRPTRCGSPLRNEQLEFGNRRKVFERTAHVADAARHQHRVFNQLRPPRDAAFRVQVHGGQNPAVGAADRECDVDGP